MANLLYVDEEHGETVYRIVDAQNRSAKPQHNPAPQGFPRRSPSSLSLCKMGEKRKINGRKKFVQYAHVTLFNRVEMVHNLNLAPGIQSVNLIRSDIDWCITQDDPLYESICWLGYLEELLTHVQTAPIYILEDVYERFQLDFDRIFSSAKNPIYIVTAPHRCRQFIRPR